MDWKNATSESSQPLPIPIQIFLWQQTSPFTRPKLGKLHESTCTFCQSAPGHHAFEKVLVQNQQFGLSPSLTEAINSIPRWRLVQGAFPHILHSTAALLHNRKENLQNLGAAESKLLYILHWIILDAAEECAEADYDKGITPTSPFYYLFSIPSITLFVYLLAPLCHQVKESDLQTFRLENGMKVWEPLWESRHPDAPCFTALAKPRRHLWPPNGKSHVKSPSKSPQFSGIFLGRKSPPKPVDLCGTGMGESPPSQTTSFGFFDQPQPLSARQTDEEGWVSSPKDTNFPETIPEESSSTEEEHVVIYRLPSIAESDGLKESSIYTTLDTSIFQAQQRLPKSPSDAAFDAQNKASSIGRGRETSGWSEEKSLSGCGGRGLSRVEASPAATLLDVGVVRCLFIPQWPEEGVYWALQFLYHRLRDVVDPKGSERQPRKRSASLPSPQLGQLSFTEASSTLEKSRLNKDFIEVPQIKDVSPRAVSEAHPSFSQKDHRHNRRASEKIKKCMKMADLKAFVETKLLSKSEKALERIGQDDSQSLYTQEYHRSLDTGDEELVRKEKSFALLVEGSTNLVKGKSMPSLRYVGETSCGGGGGGGGGSERSAGGLSEWRVTEPSPNPIITVTEHTPAPSPPDFAAPRRVRLGEAWRDEGVKKRGLIRSLSDSKISYSSDDCPEAPGAAHYITPEGDIDLLVVLKGIQNVVMRENTICSLRVCEGVLNLTEVILGMPAVANANEKQHAAQTSILTSLTRVLRGLGCPQGCEDAQRGAPADFLRSQVQSLLARLHKASPQHFLKFFKRLVRRQTIPETVDFFHAFTGFCVDPGSLLSPLNKRGTSSKSPDAVPGSLFGPSATGLESNIFGAVFKIFVTKLVSHGKELKSPENMNLYCDIRLLVSYVKEVHGNVLRRVALSGLIDTAVRPHRKESNLQTTRVIRHIPQSEQDSIQDQVFIYDEKDSKKLLFKKRSTSSTCASVREADGGDDLQSPMGNMRKKHILTPRHSQRNFNHFQKNSRFRIGGLVSWFRREVRRGESLDSQQGSQTELPLPAAAVAAETGGGGGGGGGGALAHHAAQLHHSYSKTSQKSTSSVSTTLQKAKRRVEDQFTKLGFGRGKKKDGSIEETQGSYLSRRNSVETAEGRSRDSEVVVLKARRMVKKETLVQGMNRLSILLEICQPASLPHPHLLAAVLDLAHTPVVSRAAFLLECAHFVHSCNKGQWPSWLKQNLPLCRPSGPPPSARPNPATAKRSHLLQRAAGNVFYQWAEVLGQRLEEMLAEDKNMIPQVIAGLQDEQKQKELLIEDEEEDFLDEACWTRGGGEGGRGAGCPMALRLIACSLLVEITAFLRETYQSLPKVGLGGGVVGGLAGGGAGGTGASLRGGGGPGGGGGGGGGALGSAFPSSGEAKQANRRWSMALSSMGHSQASAHSLQSIPDQGQTERKISFVLQEPEESEGSSNTTLTMQVDDGGGGGGGGGVAGGGTGGGGGRSRGRAQLLRRGTATGGGGGGGGGGTGGGAGGAATVTTSTSGSFKRRSLKLRRSKEPLYESRPPLESSAPLDCMASFSHFQVRSSEHRWFKRSDSLQNRRKVSSLSDRSDTSEQGLGSGEESPGALSDAPESPSSTNETDDSSNMPWLKVIVQMLNSYNYFCSHQQFCHPFCYRRHARATSRLVKAVRKVYGEEFGMLAERRGGEVSETVGKKGGEGKRSRKVSEQVSPVRAAKESKKDKSERHDSHSNGKLLNQIDSSDKADGTKADNEKKEHPPILKYIKAQVGWGFHRGLEALVKGGCVVPAELLAESLPSAWHLCLEPSQETAATAGALFILAAVRAPLQAAKIMDAALHHPDPAVRISACLRFKVLWKMRHQVWCRMEEGAQVTFKVPPPGIEFTLPSPKIGIESLPVVDPPWMPQVKTKVEEVTAISQESHRSLVTATKTRKKQQTELIKMALQAREDKKRCERENFMVTTIPVTIQAAYEPSLHHAVGDDHEDGGCDEEVLETGGRNTHQIHSAQSLFPSCLCTAVVRIINLLDDAAVSADGSAVYEVAYQVIWSCLVEDSALFLRYILERLTRGDQELMFKVLRHLIRFVPRLPQQAAFTLYNYIIGYVMFYVRSPQEEGQKLIGAALSILWMVVHSVHGIMFKDLKQILRKEQCDASILLTANVPSTKKIIVHGPQDESACGIPSQFPVQEDTQFFQILRESLDFFSIPEDRQKEFFLVDHKTRQIHNPNSYVRDYYFFKRSQYPQLELVHMHPDDAFNALQRQELMHKSVEIGKVLLTWAILKNVDMVVQRVVFLHEELMKLPSFPRKALEADLDLYRGGQMGKELLGLDVLHKFMWVRLIARMFEAMAGNFAYSGDIRLFLNVLNGALILHSQDATILRYVMATYINAAHNFKNIFSINGYLMVVPTLLQLYAIHQTNKLVTRTVEYCVKQFYLMNRKPFILQMFGAASPILDIDLRSQFGDAQKVPAKCLFELLLSLETPSPDPLNIGELVKEEKPLKAIDFCYHDDNEMVTVLDCISLCVMVIAYSADSVRAYQMLTILEAIVPCYLQQIQLPSYRKEGKTEREIISQIAVAINTLVTNCEALAKNYSGPQRTSPDHKGSSGQRGGAYNRAPYSPGFEYVDDPHSKYIQEKAKARTTYVESDDTETEFRRPRDVLLSLATEFATKCAARLIELNKKFPQDGKQIELLELRSQTRLAEIAHSLLKASLYNAETMGCKGPPARLADIAHSLLKASPYDAETMGCKGLQLYMTQLMPATEWNSESMRPTMVMILRRLDKTFLKIYKKPGIRRNVDWDAASGLIKGIYETLSRYPYMVHLTNLKSLVNTCQSLITGEMATGLGENISSATTALMAQVPPPHFCDMVVRLIALQILAFGDSHTLEAVCGGSNVFPTFEKTESILLNLLMPLCLRVGSGRKDVHIMREVDISYCLTVVLYGMYPPSARTPVTTQNFKMAQDFRSGSFSFTKSPLAVTKSLYQVSFLALKILIACFEGELEADWPRIARTVQELAKVTDARQYFWSFIEFVVTQRPPLFTLIQPFIRLKLNMTPISEIERHIHFVVREKMAGHSATGPKCRGNLLNDLIREMKIVKDELDSRKFKGEGGLKGGPELGPTAGDPCAPPPAVSQRHRPSLIDLLTGGNSQFTALVNIPHRESVSSVPSTNTQEPPPLLSRYHTSSEVLSPGEGEEETEGGGSESCRPRPRLQRSKAQSRKTFRHRKSRIESKKESGGGEGRGSSRREDDEERGGAAGTSTTSSSQCSGGGGGGRRGESCEDSPQTSRSPPPPPPREGAAAPPPQPPPQPLSPDSSSHSQHSFLLVFEEDTLI